MDTVLNSNEMAELLSLVEEAARSTEEGIKRLLSQHKVLSVEQLLKDTI
jgi:hypothetical protein